MRKIIKNKNLVPVTIADLNLDDSPDLNSTDPVTSRGVATAITEAVGGASDALQEQIDDIAEKAGSGYIPKGEASVATLNGLSGQENGWLYTMTDAGTITDGSLVVVAGDTVAWDATNEVWYKAMDYAPRQYGTNEVHNLPTSITAFRTGDVIPVDGPSGTAKMSKDDLLRETAENALAGNVAPAFDATKDYAVNDIVSHNGKTYRFVTIHPAGAWSGNDVESVQICMDTVTDYAGALTTRKYLATDGTEVDSSSSATTKYWCITDYIPVADYLYYIYSGEVGSDAVASCFYDGSKNFVSSFKLKTGNPVTQKIPSGASFVRLSVMYVIADATTGLQIVTISEINQVKAEIKNKADENSNIVFAENMAVTANKYLTSDGTEVDSPTSSDKYWSITDYIPVTAGKKYWYSLFRPSGSNAIMSCFYDGSKNFVSSFKQMATSYTEIEVPSGVYYVRFSILYDNGFGFNFYEYDESLVKTNGLAISMQGDEEKAEGYYICINGDSIETKVSGLWPDYIEDRLSWLNYKDIAVGGTRIQGEINSTTRINQIPTATTFVLVGGGTNDWAQDVPLGSMDTLEDAATFYGAVNLLVQRIIARVPTAKIALMSNHFGCCPNRFDSSHDDSLGIYNNIDLPIKSYMKAIKDVAEFNSIPYIPVYEECGINQFNYTDYNLRETNQQGDVVYLHPNAVGAEKIYKVVKNHVLSLFRD